MIHRDVTRAERKVVEELLDIKCDESTVNMGSPYIRSGMLCNNNGFVIGDASGGPEVVNVDEELGFLEKYNKKKETKKTATKTTRSKTTKKKTR